MSKYKIGDKVLVEGEIGDGMGGNYRVHIGNQCVIYADEDTMKDAFKTYEDGLNDAWKLARKLGSYEAEKRVEIFDDSDAFHFGWLLENYSPQEALAKIEAYEESKKEIKAGDFCVDEDGLEWLVTYVNKGTSKDDVDYHCMDKKGYTSPVLYHKGELTKTGRHIDISHLLEQIRGNE